MFLLLRRLNRKAKYLLEKDLKDKFQAQDIDEYCENLKNNSAGLHLKDGAAKIEAKCVTLICWVFLCGAQSWGGQRLLVGGGGWGDGGWGAVGRGLRKKKGGGGGW